MSLYDFFAAFERSFREAGERSAREQSETRRATQILGTRDALQRRRDEEKRQQSLAGYLELGEGYGETWDFSSPEAAKAYYEGSFLPERERERKESERFYRRQELTNAFQSRGMSPEDADMHSRIAEESPEVYRLLFPQPKVEDPTKREDRLYRQSIQDVEDMLLDQIPNYYGLRPEDRSALVGQVESYARRGKPWYVGEDEKGNPVIRPGRPPKQDPDDEDVEMGDETPGDPYGGRMPPEAGPGGAVLDALGQLLFGGGGGGYGLYEPGEPTAGGERTPSGEPARRTTKRPSTERRPKVKGIRRVQ